MIPDVQGARNASPPRMHGAPVLASHAGRWAGGVLDPSDPKYTIFMSPAEFSTAVSHVWPMSGSPLGNWNYLIRYAGNSLLTYYMVTGVHHSLYPYPPSLWPWVRVSLLHR